MNPWRLSSFVFSLCIFFFSPFAFGQTYDGSWSGTTSQGKAVSFEVSSNAIPQLAIAGDISAVGCSGSFEQTTQFGFPEPITGSTFSITRNTSAGGAISFTFSGSFSSPTSASGSLTFHNNPIPGVPICVGSGSATWTATRAGGTPPVDSPIDGVLAVVGSLEGGFGSFFKTTIQMFNDSSSTVSGSIVFHPAGASGQSSDPSLPFSLGPMETTAWEDLLPAMGQAGIGSADIIMDSGEMPIIFGRIYNDEGELGTSGMGFGALRPGKALQAGDTGVLVAPRDPSTTRLNIGVRTLDDGVNVMITVRSQDSTIRTTVAKSWPPNWFEQNSASAVLGIELGPSDSISIAINSGSAFFYGAANDNTTQDPTMRFAKSTLLD